MIMDHMLPEDPAIRRLDFEDCFDGNAQVNCDRYDDHEYLPPPPYQSRALLRACRQTRADFIAHFLSKATIRFHIMGSHFKSTDDLIMDFCEDPNFSHSPAHRMCLPRDWLSYLTEVTLWLELPQTIQLTSTSTSWSALSALRSLRKLSIVYKTPWSFANRRTGRSVSSINDQGSSTWLLGALMELLRAIPKDVEVSFADHELNKFPTLITGHILESGDGNEDDASDGEDDEEEDDEGHDDDEMIWKPQAHSFHVTEQLHGATLRCITRKHQEYKEQIGLYERQGPRRPRTMSMPFLEPLSE